LHYHADKKAEMFTKYKPVTRPSVKGKNTKENDKDIKNKVDSIEKPSDVLEEEDVDYGFG